MAGLRKFVQPTTDHWSPAAVASGGLLVLSGMLPWVAHGPGSSYRGVELAAVLFGSGLVPANGRLLGVLVLVVGLIGVGHLATLANVGPVATLIRGVSGGAVVASMIAVAVGFGWSSLGSGPWCATLGGAIAFGTWVASVIARTRQAGEIPVRGTDRRRPRR